MGAHGYLVSAGMANVLLSLAGNFAAVAAAAKTLICSPRPQTILLSATALVQERHLSLASQVFQSPFEDESSVSCFVAILRPQGGSPKYGSPRKCYAL